MEILYMLTGAVLFAAGFTTCFFIVKKPSKPKEKGYTEVKRVMPSMRNPLRTYDVRYDKYKTKDDLYQPVIPKRKTAVNEVEYGEG